VIKLFLKPTSVLPKKKMGMLYFSTKDDSRLVSKIALRPLFHIQTKSGYSPTDYQLKSTLFGKTCQLMLSGRTQSRLLTAHQG